MATPNYGYEKRQKELAKKKKKEEKLKAKADKKTHPGQSGGEYGGSGSEPEGIQPNAADAGDTDTTAGSTD